MQTRPRFPSSMRIFGAYARAYVRERAPRRVRFNEALPLSFFPPFDKRGARTKRNTSVGRSIHRTGECNAGVNETTVAAAVTFKAASFTVPRCRSRVDGASQVRVDRYEDVTGDTINTCTHWCWRIFGRARKSSVVRIFDLTCCHIRAVADIRAHTLYFLYAKKKIAHVYVRIAKPRESLHVSIPTVRSLALQFCGFFPFFSLPLPPRASSLFSFLLGFRYAPQARNRVET